MLFHVLVMVKIIPFDIVRGGRVQSDGGMYRFELVSLALNTFFLSVILINSEILKIKVPDKIIKVILWLMFALFLLNTVGNLLSNNQLEKIIFTPITILLAIFSFILARTKQ
jgi:hypothetical protein